jgi:hypothetical protein
MVIKIKAVSPISILTNIKLPKEKHLVPLLKSTLHLLTVSVRHLQRTPSITEQWKR